MIMLLAKGSNGGGNNASRGAPASHVQWYYPVGAPASPFHHHALPFYGYVPFIFNFIIIIIIYFYFSWCNIYIDII